MRKVSKMNHEYNTNDENHQHNVVAIRVSKVTIIINLSLALIKMFAGIVGHSGAMVADAVHGFSDVFGSFVIIVGSYIADIKADEDHPHLQRKIEGTISVFLSTLLLFIAAEIGYNAINTIIGGDYENLKVPTLLPLIVAIVSIGIKEGLYRYSSSNAKKIQSVALQAMAWHHRTDALVTISSFIGIMGSRLGHPVFDPIVSLIISLLVVKVAVEIFIEAIRSIKNKEI